MNRIKQELINATLVNEEKLDIL